MPSLSQQKKDKIAEQMLHHLFTIAPDSQFTSDIARELARDEEFTLALLKELKRRQIIVEVTKNAAGKDYLKRRRWRLSNAAYEAYKKHQLKQEDFPLIQFSSKEPLFDN